MTALGQQHHHHPHPPIHEATMRFLLHKYLSKNAPGAKNDQPGMPPPPSVGAEPDNGCLAGCVPVRTKRGTTAATAGATTTTSTTRTSRQNFVKSAATTLFPSTVQFTNHESLPALPDAYSGFVAAFPQYGGVGQADAIRDGEYQHLDRHVCLDYTGINLFSHAQMNASVPSTSATPPAAASVLWQPPFFDIAYKSTSLRSHVQCGGDGGAGIGAAMTKRIMASLKIPEDEYRMVCTANRTTAFRLLAESYSFQPGKKLLAVYDYESEAVAAMAESAQRRGADIMSASFTWPSMRVHSPELRKKLARGRRRGRQPRRGLFVYPLLSRMTGARYPYLWMSLAQEHGWHVALDACGLGTKDLDTLGLSLIRPDFIVCNFFKVFGENPSGFAGLFVKKSSCDGLEASTIARSIGIVSIVPARRWSLHEDYSNSTDLEGAYSLSLHRTIEATPDADADADTASSFSGPITAANYSTASARKAVEADTAEHGETSEIRDDVAAGTMEVEAERAKNEHEVAIEIECRGLDHADELGLIHIGNRLRCITNWLIVAMQKLRHPHAEDGRPLVRVYGPRVKFERGPSVAFNVYDWKGEKVAPALVQKLADRHNISLTCGFLRNIWFADKYEADKNAVLEHRAAAGSAGAVGGSGKRKDSGGDMGIYVVNASLGFLSNFEDAYRLWAFVAKFLDADFVEKERWRYTALNQKTVEV